MYPRVLLCAAFLQSQKRQIRWTDEMSEDCYSHLQSHCRDFPVDPQAYHTTRSGGIMLYSAHRMEMMSGDLSVAPPSRSIWGHGDISSNLMESLNHLCKQHKTSDCTCRACRSCWVM